MTRKRNYNRIKALGAAITFFTIVGGGFAGINHTIQVNKDYAAYIESQNEDLKDVVNQQDALIDEQRAAYDDLKEENQELRYKVEGLQREVSRGNARAINVEVTAYDLSEASCNKGPGHPAYGLTASGKNLAGLSREGAMSIAVDPRVIPLGSKVRIKFNDESMQKYNGVYTAVDTGGAIGGSRIDLFMGDGSHNECMRFGRRTAKAVIL